MVNEVNPLVSRIKRASWPELTTILNSAGWELEINRPQLKRFRRGPQQLALVRVSKRKWKVEYMFGRRIDSAGVMNEEYAKVLAAELGVIRAFFR